MLEACNDSYKKRGRGELPTNIVKEGGSGGGGDHVVHEEGKGNGESSDHDQIHIWTERERRKKMRNMFANLHASLPQLPPKADKSTIVDEAVNYIKTLQQTLHKLQKQKLKRLQGAMTNTYGYEPSLITPQKLATADTREAFLADLQGPSTHDSAKTASKPRNNHSIIPSSTFQTWASSNVVLNTCGDEAQISICSPKMPGLFTTVCCVLDKYNIKVLSAHVSSDCYRCMYMIQAHAGEASNDQLVEACSVEEIFRQASGEIACWVSSATLCN